MFAREADAEVIGRLENESKRRDEACGERGLAIGDGSKRVPAPPPQSLHPSFVRWSTASVLVGSNRTRSSQPFGMEACKAHVLVWRPTGRTFMSRGIVSDRRSEAKATGGGSVGGGRLKAMLECTPSRFCDCEWRDLVGFTLCNQFSPNGPSVCSTNRVSEISELTRPLYRIFLVAYYLSEW